MSDTVHISMRISKELLGLVDEQARRMRWSRNAALGTCVEFGVVELAREVGVGVRETGFGGNKKNSVCAAASTEDVVQDSVDDAGNDESTCPLCKGLNNTHVGNCFLG